MGKLRRQQDWSDMVVRCQSSGLSVRNWCEQADLTTSTYYYRQQQVLKLIPDAAMAVPEQAAIKPPMAFVRLPAPTDARSAALASITIHMGKISIAVEGGVDATTLERF